MRFKNICEEKLSTTKNKIWNNLFSLPKPHYRLDNLIIVIRNSEDHILEQASVAQVFQQ